MAADGVPDDAREVVAALFHKDIGDPSETDIEAVPGTPGVITVIVTVQSGKRYRVDITPE